MKTPYSIDESIELLKRRGLIINDEDSTHFFLSRVNYFRLSGYFFHFQIKNKDSEESKQNYNDFIKETSFCDIERLYVFDQKLRILLFEAIERIETFFCTVLNEEMLSLSGDSHWYVDAKYFKGQRGKEKSKYYNFIKNKIEEPKYVTNLFIQKYNKDCHEIDVPYSWMIMELLSFGEVLRLYTDLKQKYKIQISKKCFIRANQLSNILQIIRYLRNASAHHSRIWNKKMSYSFSGNIPYTKKDNNYQTGVKIIIFMFSKIGFNSTWNQRMINLFEESKIEKTDEILLLLKTLSK